MKFRSSADKARYLESQKSWDEVVKKHSSVKPFSTRKNKTEAWIYKLEAPAGREAEEVRSVVTPGGVGSLKESPCYTGENIKGIGTMHKSNMVPIFNSTQAKDIASMRR